MKSLGLLLSILAFASGCTAISLRRHTVEQGNTYADMIYREVIDNLAMVANNPDVLPSFSVMDFGSADVTDKFGETGVLLIPPLKAAGSGSIDFLGARAIKENWTLTPVVAPEKLRALHLAFAYAVYHDPHLLTIHDHRVSLDVFRYPYNLKDHCVCPPIDTCNAPPCSDGYVGEPGYYFNVSDQLTRLNTGWLHVGSKKDVPRCAHLQSHCCDTYVWVNGNEMTSFSKFTLIIQQIARQVVGESYYPKPASYTFYTPVPVYWSCKGPNDPKGTQTQCVCYTIPVTLPVDCYGDIVAQKVRLEGIQLSDKKLNSSISATTKGP